MILLTGATGTIGGAILSHLEAAGQSLCLLVRQKNGQAAQDRIGGKHHLVFEGDLSQPFFGMPISEYRALCNSVDTIIHCAANINLFSTEKQMMHDNVTATQHILEFQKTGISKKLLYVSTFAVLGSRLFEPDFVFTENDLDVDQNFIGMPYQKSKFVCEQIVRKHSESFTIVRPGQVFSVGGKGNIFQSIIHTALKAGVTPVSDYRFDITPVDFIARSISTIVQNNIFDGRTYHLNSPHPPSMREIADFLGVEAVPWREYINHLVDHRLVWKGRTYTTPATYAFYQWFNNKNFNFDGSATISNLQTQRDLSKLNVSMIWKNSDLVSGAHA